MFTNFRNPLWRPLLALALLFSFTIAACGDERPRVPSLPTIELPDNLPNLDDLPAVPPALRELPGVLEELGLPDLSGIANLPELSDLPALLNEPGTVAFNGPLERRLRVGERLPGTNIQLVSVSAESVEFTIDGLRSVRVVGDSLDYDGAWLVDGGAAVGETTYNVRLRIYRLGSGSVRAAGVHQLRVANAQPIEREVAIDDGAEDDVGYGTESDATVQFPFTVGAAPGEPFPGTTLGYAGEDEAGATLSGLPAGDYPYRRTGDSLRWSGTLREDVTARYNLRLLSYDATGARVGGVVTLSLAAR